MTEEIGFSWLAGASLPAAAFFLLGIYGRAWRMLPGVVVLGIGHTGVHLGCRRVTGRPGSGHPPWGRAMGGRTSRP